MAQGGQAATPRILGVTGSIGCGKTTVGDLLLALGARERIDADAVVHQLMVPGTEATKEIGRVFGPEVLLPDGAVDRPHLGEIVFADRERLRRLEKIVHPAVRTAIRKRLEELRGEHGVVVVDAVKLLESNLLDLVEAVWVVRCEPSVQLRRLMETRRMPREAAQMRLRAQPSFEHARVTQVIENSGSLDELETQVRAAWKAYLAVSHRLERE